MTISRRALLTRLGALCAASSLSRPFFAVAGASDPDELVPLSKLAADPLRPRFHLLPARNWMNDPNGPIYWKSQYHMFFQYNPGAAVWGDMHWAHATSPDMIHWKHQPIALAPTPGGFDSEGCFSGSAVNDNGTATFLYTGVKSVPASEATLRDGTHNFLEVQCLATSHDPSLRKWVKLPGPVLLPPAGTTLTGFRDPCLWRDGRVWYLGVGSGQPGLGGNVLLYRSSDLRHWEYVHVLASGKKNSRTTSDPVDSGEMWECPDFFALGKKHVLLFSTERKVYWQTGELDPKELVFHSQKQGLLDNGAFYAPKSQLDAKGRRILWGWIPETRPEAEFSAAGWAGCMSLPRELTLTEEGELKMQILPQVQQLRGSKLTLSATKADSGSLNSALGKMKLPGATAEFDLRAQIRPLQLNLTDGNANVVSIDYDPARATRQLRIGKEFATVPAISETELQLRLFIDGSVIECMINGTTALTARTYVAPAGELRFTSPTPESDSITALSVWPIRPISPDRLTT